MWSSIFHSIFHGTLRERDAIILAAAAGVALGVGMVSAWLGAHFGAKRAVRRAFRDRIEIPSIVTEVRYDELSRAIDAIALEIERLSEAQRFAAKMLVERPASGSVSAPTVAVAAPTVTATAIPRREREPGVTTPH
jgi:NAD(P)H-hydrate repair Nnr-like enzyme with NAD(P)H-hydrate dehydratase domain